MKPSIAPRIVPALIGLLMMICFYPFSGLAQDLPPKDSKPEKIIVVTLFTSSDCPFCDHVKELLEDLKTTFPIKTDVFDINQPADYDLFSKVGSLYKHKNFAVPLVIVGNEVMVGQSEIFGGIEKTIRLWETSKESPPSIRELALEASRGATSGKIGPQKVESDPKLNNSKNSRLQNNSKPHKLKIISDNPN